MGILGAGGALGEPDKARVLIDAGPPGLPSLADHGHTDALAFTLSVRLEAGEAGVTPTLYRASTDPIAGWISRGFGHIEATTAAVFRDRNSGSVRLITRISIAS